jgi:hypothetical protein
MPDYREFLRILRGEPGRAVLFDPFPHRSIVTQLLWRAGEHLWDTTEHRVSTLIDYYNYVKSDVAIIKAEEDLDIILGLSHLLYDGMKFVILSDDIDILARADTSDSVCALATTNRKIKSIKKPLIYLSKSGYDDDTLANLKNDGFAGIYAATDAEKYIERQKDLKIAILGGLGTDYINSSEPLQIYNRIRLLFENSRCTWAVGTGGFGEKTEYLGYISMLGALNKLI